ncbi:MAG: transposase [Gammaproteobacteria bacterium]|nr:transposase [Gammaproteobacteria bacterium]
MPKPRYTQVSLAATPYYHCTSRCVRRAFLCGTDALSGQSFEHRRQWIEDKLLELGAIFACDICAYAVMSNHYHIVLHVNTDKADNWSMDETITRWHQLFTGTLLSQRYIKGEMLIKAELDTLKDSVVMWRDRLKDISWYMRVLNKFIARQANNEDNCTGRFWEGRFKLQALLDDAALAACMAYVDLNPVRSTIASTPEDSYHTSIRQRFNASKVNNHQPIGLHPFIGNPRSNMPEGLPFKLVDYLELVDWTGRIIREDKKGYIESDIPPILKRLNMASDNWLYLALHFESPFKGLVGSVLKLKAACKKLGYQRIPGIKSCASYFP